MSGHRTAMSLPLLIDWWQWRNILAIPDILPIRLPKFHVLNFDEISAKSLHRPSVRDRVFAEQGDACRGVVVIKLL